MNRAICLLCWKTAGYMSLSPQIYPGAHSVTLVVITLTLAPVLFYSVWIFEMTPQTTEYIHIWLLFKSKEYVQGENTWCYTLGIQEAFQSQAPYGPKDIQRMCLMGLKLPRSVQRISFSEQLWMDEAFNESSYQNPLFSKLSQVCHTS